MMRTQELTASAQRARFRSMLRIRMVEETIADRYVEQEMRCPVHLSIGQEAVAVGVASALAETDYVMSTHRAHAHYLAKGGDLRAMIAELYGRETGCAGGRGGSMHLIDERVGFLGAVPIVGATVPLAVGTAFASWQRNEQRVSIVFFGDGMTEEGAFSEALNFAAVKQLPIVFVCENNRFSVYSPMSVRQSPYRDRCGIARAHGVSAEDGDGQDVEAVARLASEAITRARSGDGPSYIEFETFRYREHCGPNTDDELGYRGAEHIGTDRDPLPRAMRELVGAGAILPHELDEMAHVIRCEIDEAFAFAKSSAFPAQTDALRHVYSEIDK